MKLAFKKPYVMTVTLDQGEHGLLLIHDNKDLSIFTQGYTLEELTEDFFEAFTSVWQGYVQVDESILGKDAIRLKNNLLSIAEEVK